MHPISPFYYSSAKKNNKFQKSTYNYNFCFLHKKFVLYLFTVTTKKPRFTTELMSFLYKRKNTHYLMLAFSYFHSPSPGNYLRHYRA